MYKKFVKMKPVYVIVDPEPPSYDQSFGHTVDGKVLAFRTNFNSNIEHIYREAIRTYKGPGDFGICDTAFFFDEDEGISGSLGGHKGFYSSNHGSTSDFFRHYDTVFTKHYPTSFFATFATPAKIKKTRRLSYDIKSNKTTKRMMRCGNRITREVGRQRRDTSNNSARRFAMWWMQS